jgi:hypothetical protein
MFSQSPNSRNGLIMHHVSHWMDGLDHLLINGPASFWHFGLRGSEMQWKEETLCSLEVSVAEMPKWLDHGPRVPLDGRPISLLKCGTTFGLDPFGISGFGDLKCSGRKRPSILSKSQ